MDATAIHDALKDTFADAIVDATLADVPDPTVQVAPEALSAVATFLRDDEALAFDSLQCLSAVDYPEPDEAARIEILYHLYSFEHKHKIALRVKLPRDHPVVASVTSVWPAADWHEREAYDLMGVVFQGHPNLRRILLPDDWEGHPLRKDYEFPEEYGGIRGK